MKKRNSLTIYYKDKLIDDTSLTFHLESDVSDFLYSIEKNINIIYDGLKNMTIDNMYNTIKSNLKILEKLFKSLY